MKDYLATTDLFYRYPGAGDEKPPGGAKVLLLTRGGICVTGPWSDDGRYLGWAPMPKRDQRKEEQLAPKVTGGVSHRGITYTIKEMVNPDSGRLRWGVEASDGVMHFPQRYERTAALRLMKKLMMEAS